MSYSEPYSCFVPSLQALHVMYQQYPNSTILLSVRNTDDWYNSAKNWYNGGLLNAMRHCNAPGFPAINATADDFKQFYEWYTHYYRNFAAKHPSIKYIEVQLESPESGAILERELGISSKQCWKHLHKSSSSSNAMNKQ